MNLETKEVAIYNDLDKILDDTNHDHVIARSVEFVRKFEKKYFLFSIWNKYYIYVNTNLLTEEEAVNTLEQIILDIEMTTKNGKGVKIKTQSLEDRISEQAQNAYAELLKNRKKEKIVFNKNQIIVEHERLERKLQDLIAKIKEMTAIESFSIRYKISNTIQRVKIEEVTFSKLLKPGLILICSNLKREKLSREEIYLRLQRHLHRFDLSVKEKMEVENIVTNELKDYY